MEQLPIIDECHQKWWELQCQVKNFYSGKERRRPPLSQQKEFRSIKNAVIQEAENIRMGKVTFEDEEMEDRDGVAAQYALGQLYLTDDPEVRDTELGIQWLECAARHGSDRAAYQLGKEYLRGKVVARDAVKAKDYLTQSAEAGNQYAQYALGKLYLDRQDHEQAHYWFSQSAAQGDEYAQFFLDRWDNLKPPSVMLSVSRLLHHMSRIFQEQMPALTVPGGIQIDRKRLAQLREKKIAMGHKPDDHEEQAPSWTMTMG